MFRKPADFCAVVIDVSVAIQEKFHRSPTQIRRHGCGERPKILTIVRSCRSRQFSIAASQFPSFKVNKRRLMEDLPSDSDAQRRWESGARPPIRKKERRNKSSLLGQFHKSNHYLANEASYGGPSTLLQLLSLSLTHSPVCRAPRCARAA